MRVSVCFLFTLVLGATPQQPEVLQAHTGAKREKKSDGGGILSKLATIWPLSAVAKSYNQFTHRSETQVESWRIGVKGSQASIKNPPSRAASWIAASWIQDVKVDSRAALNVLEKGAKKLEHEAVDRVAHVGQGAINLEQKMYHSEESGVVELMKVGEEIATADKAAGKKMGEAITDVAHEIKKDAKEVATVAEKVEEKVEEKLSDSVTAFKDAGVAGLEVVDRVLAPSAKKVHGSSFIQESDPYAEGEEKKHDQEFDNFEAAFKQDEDSTAADEAKVSAMLQKDGAASGAASSLLQDTKPVHHKPLAHKKVQKPVQHTHLREKVEEDDKPIEINHQLEESFENDVKHDMPAHSEEELKEVTQDAVNEEIKAEKSGEKHDAEEKAWGKEMEKKEKKLMAELTAPIKPHKLHHRARNDVDLADDSVADEPMEVGTDDTPEAAVPGDITADDDDLPSETSSDAGADEGADSLLESSSEPESPKKKLVENSLMQKFNEDFQKGFEAGEGQDASSFAQVESDYSNHNGPDRSQHHHPFTAPHTMVPHQTTGSLHSALSEIQSAEALITEDKEKLADEPSAESVLVNADGSLESKHMRQGA